eukprot:scaffold14931_cov197-Amphora_coffeaeformis.AAC.3
MTQQPGQQPGNVNDEKSVEKQRLPTINLDGESSSSTTNESWKVKARTKGLARAYKRMDSKRALSSSKLNVSTLSPIKETKPKLTSNLSNRSILSLADFVDFDESSLHDSILEDNDFSEVSFDDESGGGSLHIDFSDSYHGLMNPGDSTRSLNSSANQSIPPELLMEDPSLAVKGMKKKSLSRQDSCSSTTSLISSSGDSVDTFVLSQIPRC